MRLLTELRLAASFLTVVPFGGSLSPSRRRMARSMAYFPLVGLGIGLLLALLNAALSSLLPRAVLDCLLLLVLILVTGGLHLDGLADLTDGLCGGRDRDRILLIMKDSRVGAMGAVALVMVLLLKYLALYQISPEYKTSALLFMPLCGRWVQVILAVFCPYARPEGGTGASFVEHAGEREFLMSTGFALLAALMLFGMQGVFLFFLVGLLGMGLMKYFLNRLGGVTGDILGASCEIVEVAVLVLLPAVLR